ncbi:hypothetical protein HY967_04445 [Candidatus Jorgensenbacteria bacterium]|nr:hypothetical protein [Candidatus Jorgensenbacteria bacterium]
MIKKLIIMPFRLRKNHKRIAIIAVIVAILLGAVYWAWLSVSRRVPEEFLVARKNAADVSQKIVRLTSDTNTKIKDINISELSGNPDEAISFIKEARASNNEAYNQAFELARNLQKLAESLKNFRSEESQRLAYEAVAVELALVSEFIVYTQHLNRFFDSLTKVVATDSFADRRSVEESLKDVNREVIVINSLNKEFVSKIKAFDDSL